MKPFALPEGLDLKAAFGGTSPTAFPEDVGTPDEKLLRNLCLQRHHNSSSRGRAVKVSLTMSAYNSRDDLATRNLPLHKIPHYCFGSVAGSTKSLLIFIFFPELHFESQYQHTTYLSKQDQQLWLDAGFLTLYRVEKRTMAIVALPSPGVKPTEES
ncbi:hypothetical protein DPSP01_014622 [Paraphaeosphaeria sporulosa]